MSRYFDDILSESSRETPRSGIARSFGRSAFSFLKSFRIDFHSGWTCLHSHHQCTSVLLCLYPYQYWLLVLLMTLILVGWELNVVFEFLYG